MPVINILKLTPIRLKNSNTNNWLTKTSVNIHDTLSYSLKHAFQNSFPSIKCKCTTKEIENMSLKSSNSFGYDEVPTKTLKLRPPFINLLFNYMCNTTLLTGVFSSRLQHGFIRPLFKRGNINYLQLQANINLFFKIVWKSNAHWTAETSDWS
jgi:hypothetical protein